MNICLYEHLIQTVVLNILIHLSQDVCGGTVQHLYCFTLV